MWKQTENVQSKLLLLIDNIQQKNSCLLLAFVVHFRYIYVTIRESLGKYIIFEEHL